jgi:hypothetical protein
LNDAIGFVPCKPVEGNLKKVLTFIFERLILALKQMVFAILGYYYCDLECTGERVLFSIIDVDFRESNNYF